MMSRKLAWLCLCNALLLGTGRVEEPSNTPVEVPVDKAASEADGPTIGAPITASALRQALGLDVSRAADPDRLQVADAGV